MTMKFGRMTGASAALLLFAAMRVVYAQNENTQGENQGKPDPSKSKHEKGARRGRTRQAKLAQDREGQPIRSPERQALLQRPQAPQSEPAREQFQDAQQARSGPRQAPQHQRPEQVRERPQRSEKQALEWQRKRGWQHGGAWRGQTTWQRGRAERWSYEHRTWKQRGGYGGYYIPQERFNLYFGKEHLFHLGSRPVMDMGYPRFEYSGIAFLLLDPYPEYWAENWYELDDVYIDYEDGYYLRSLDYPHVRLAIMVAL